MKNNCSLRYKPDLNNVLAMNKLSANTIKSNFCPSFGIAKKEFDVQLKERNTGKAILGTLKKEHIGNTYVYKLLVGREEAGFMYLNLDSILPEEEYVTTEPDSDIPQISRLRSLRGDKYSGIGSTLVSAAVRESKKRGKNGSLWLVAEKGFAKDYSEYRSDENPIPFYYKLGFVAVDKKTDNLIKNCIDEIDKKDYKAYKMLPDSAILLLTTEAAATDNKYLSKKIINKN
jgi:GNAT superfamily N-acetyltransferase